MDNKKQNKCDQELSSNGITVPCQAIDEIHILDVALQREYSFYL